MDQPGKLAQPAWAPTNPIAHILNVADGCCDKVVDVANWATNDGARIQMWDWRWDGNIKNQQWSVANPSGWTTLVNVNANKCLDESAPRNGATVYIYHCTGAKNQEWAYEVVNPNVIRLRNQQDGRCLDSKDYNMNNGAPLQIWDCTGAWNQDFGLNDTPSSGTRGGRLIGTVPQHADFGELRLDPDPAGTWRLRPVTTADADRQFLFALHQAAMGPYITAIFGWDEAVQLGFHDRWFGGLQQQQKQTAWIIVTDGEDIGVVQVCDEVDHLYLSRVEVLPARQGRGVGSSVIRALQTLAARQDRPVRLHVFEINPARRLYERLGFSVAEQVEGRWMMQWQPHPTQPSSLHRR